MPDLCARTRLPRTWPSQVRSAIIHSISLAHFALTCAPGRGAGSRGSHVRFRRESEHLRQELNLLREEMRLKDARMGHIAAHRRPYYRPIERLAILELRVRATAPRPGCRPDAGVLVRRCSRIS